MRQYQYIYTPNSVKHFQVEGFRFHKKRKGDKREQRWRCPKPRRSCLPIRSSFSGISLSLSHSISLSLPLLKRLCVCICSKSYCPFCTQVKQLFRQLGITYKAIELDTECKCFSLLKSLYVRFDMSRLIFFYGLVNLIAIFMKPFI